MYFHGGGYSSGSNRHEARALLHHLAARGRTCISAAYRLRPRFGFADHLSDGRSALAWAHSNAPPFFIAHGDHDSFVPVEDARALNRHLAAGSAQEVWYAELPGGQHGFDAFASWRFTAVINGIDAFLDQTLTTRRA